MIRPETGFQARRWAIALFGVACFLLTACETKDQPTSAQIPQPSPLSVLQPSPSAPPPVYLPAPTPTIDLARRPGPGMSTSAMTADGSLWYAFDVFDDLGGVPFGAQDQGLFRLKDGRVSHFDIPLTVRVLAVAPDDSLYIGAGCGVLRYKEEQLETLLPIDCSSNVTITGFFPLDIVFGADGLVWVGGVFNLASFDGHEWQVYDFPAWRVAEADDGAIWTVGWDGREGSECCLTRLMAGEIMTYTWAADIPANPGVLQELFK